MRIASFAAAIALAAVTSAHAGTLLNTGTPNGAGFPLMLSADQGLAVQFTTTDTESIDSLLAFLTDPDGINAGATFQVAVYSQTGSTALPATQLYAADATFGSDGWNGASGLNWAIAPGTYWAVIQETASSTANGLVATGNVPVGPALAAYSDFGRWYASTEGFGVQVTASPVGQIPEPASVALLLAGLGLVGTVAHRRRG